MRISHPRSAQIPMLRQLWKAVFADTDAFLDSFFSLAYHPERCLCASEGETLTGMLYWLPCGEYAYIYAVATHPDHRSKGICRNLMEAAHEAIVRQGYEGAILYPQEEGLRAMYRKMGYHTETSITQREFFSGTQPAPLTFLSGEEYFALRQQYLPEGAVCQGSPFREMLTSLIFCRGDNFLLAAEDRGDTLFGLELLGNPEQAPGILKTLGKAGGTFRFPGNEKSFAMFCPLRKDFRSPKYFAFPLD